MPFAAIGVFLIAANYCFSSLTASSFWTKSGECRAGIRLSTFALIEDYVYMDWVGFVDQMTRLTRGVAFYCASDVLTNSSPRRA